MKNYQAKETSSHFALNSVIFVKWDLKSRQL